MSVTVDPPPAAPPDFPVRPLPPGFSRRARRTATRMRIARAVAVLVAGATIGTVSAVSVTSAPPKQARPAPEPPPGELEYIPRPVTPRTAVGLGGNAWVHAQGWCIGDLVSDNSTGTIDSCRFLPSSGELDVAVLDPGKYAPAGYSLVVAIAVGPPVPDSTFRGSLTDSTGTGTLTTDRAPGLPGVVFLWGFTHFGPVSVEVVRSDGTAFASCTNCMAGGR